MRSTVTAEEIVKSIGRLPRDRAYCYVNPKTTEVIEVVDVTYPEGPIKIRRFSPSKGEIGAAAPIDSIGSAMIGRVAAAIQCNHPIQLDRVLGASYNTRSVLESLMAYTPEFYYCYPGRVEIMQSTTEIKRGHKHLLWQPDNPHELGKLVEAKTDIVISESTFEVVYKDLYVPQPIANGMDIQMERRHAQIQVALMMIGRQLGYLSWIARNDKGVQYEGQRLEQQKGVIPSEGRMPLVNGFPGAAQAASLVDCIWFDDSREMPAVMEIEHTTGVTSGLTRMAKLRDVAPGLATRYVVVAPDELRHKVVSEANKEVFRPLDARFFSYSAVEELYSLCQKRRITGVTTAFLDSFMERAIGSDSSQMTL